MSLRLVKPGDDGSDREALDRADEACRLIREAAKAGGQFFVVLDGDEPSACYWGSPVEVSALAEEVAGMCKRMALGLE